MSETFYEVLGVGPDATTDEITAAYRDRIKETHPDVSDAEDAEEQAKRVIEAKEVLTDEDERARYDRLGHDSYVHQTKVDADWGDPGSGSGVGTNPGAGSGVGTDPSSAAEQATGTGTDSTGSSGTTWAGRDERRRGRTEDDWRWDDSPFWNDDPGDTGDANSTSTSGSAGTGGPTGSASSASTASANAGAGAGADADGGKRRRRSTAENVGEAVGWAAGVDGRHAVRHGTEREGVHRSRLFPSQDSLVLLIATFVCYPSLVFASFYPGFPIPVNLLVGLCTIVIVAYLMSMPEVGAYVFGPWSVLATLITLTSGFSAFSLLGIVVLGSTWIPFGMTLLTYRVLQW